MYADYYARQSGGDMPVFAGARFQRGHGLGNFFAGVKRFAIPLLKRGAKFLLPRLFKTGTEVVHDVMEGKKFKEAAKNRFKGAVKEGATELGPRLFNTGRNIFDDVMSGRKFKEAAQDRIFGDINENEQETGVQSGSGFRKRRKVTRRKSLKRLKLL